jgi:hypothetical protein
LSVNLAIRIIQINSYYYFFVSVCWVLLTLVPSTLILLFINNSPILIFFFFLVSLVGIFELPIKNLSYLGEVERDIKFKFKPVLISIIMCMLQSITSSNLIQILIGLISLFVSIELVQRHNKKHLMSDIIIYIIALILAPPTLLTSIPFAISLIINRRIIENFTKQEKYNITKYISRKI